MEKDKRTIKIVQFPHPVGEHYAPGNSYSEADGSGKIMPWCPATKAPARKFMKAKGQIVTDGKLSDPTDLLFWGEWEADSRFVGMYSFVPCRPYADDKGFERPRLYAKDFAKIENECSMPKPFLNDELSRAPKGTTVTTEQARRLWLCVRDIIREKGYVEGVNLKYETK